MHSHYYDNTLTWNFRRQGRDIIDDIIIQQIIVKRLNGNDRCGRRGLDAGNSCRGDRLNIGNSCRGDRRLNVGNGS